MVNKQRLIDEFLELVQIDSPSSKEGKVAQVLVKKLEEIGCEVIIDNAGEKTGGETGNVIATLKGNRSGKKILFSSHMDTVSPSIGVKPIIDEANGIIKSDGTTVLGSDDKAGIAAILEGLRNIKENNIDHADIQVVFSIWEEGGLHGAKNLDYSKIDAEYAFVLDSGGSPGEIIVKAPAQDAIKVKITGKPAHAGLHAGGRPQGGSHRVLPARDRYGGSAAAGRGVTVSPSQALRASSPKGGALGSHINPAVLMGSNRIGWIFLKFSCIIRIVWEVLL